jgi:hypothetical protein
MHGQCVAGQRPICASNPDIAYALCNRLTAGIIRAFLVHLLTTARSSLGFILSHTFIAGLDGEL